MSQQSSPSRLGTFSGEVGRWLPPERLTFRGTDGQEAGWPTPHPLDQTSSIRQLFSISVITLPCLSRHRHAFLLTHPFLEKPEGAFQTRSKL